MTPRNMYARLWFALGSEFVVFAVLLFGGAGTVRWSAGWAFLVLFFGLAAIGSLLVARRDPALLEERLKPPVQAGQPLWDKVLLLSVGAGFLMWLVIMGGDAQRFHWSVLPLWLQIAGGCGIVVGFWIALRALLENAFAVNVVKIQEGRHQTVISTGPYAVVRHPLYSGALFMLPSIALLLGSWWGVIGALLLDAGIVLRTALEDRELQRGLPGYREYAARVRFRLVPFVW